MAEAEQTTRERAERGDLLFLVHRVLYPPDKGEKIRAFHELGVLSGLGWRSHLCALADDPADLAHDAPLKRWYASVFLEPLPGATVTDRVDDVRPYVWGASVSVAPFRIALGIQNKVLEVMAMGKAVAVTPEALEGIGAEPGRHVLRADNASSFSDAVIGVIRDGSFRSRLEQNARDYVVKNHSRQREMKKLESLISHEEPSNT